jgi:virulence-associated protein VapD
MTARFMLLPARNVENIRLVKIPDDFDQRDALRHATSLIASVEEDNAEYTWEDIAPILEDHGFVPVEFMVGPDLD